MGHFFKRIFGGIAACLAFAGLEAAPVQADYTTVELIAESRGIVPGESFDVAIRFELEPHWHIYWQNPGASGLPLEITWELPEGIEAGVIQWPVPERIPLEGLMNYGYEDTAVFIVPMRASEDLELGATVSLKADLFWLICKEMCLPGDASVALQLPVVEVAELSSEASAFSTARDAHPLENDHLQSTAYVDGEALVLLIESDQPLFSELYFYADAGGWIDPNAAQTATAKSASSVELRLQLDGPFFEDPPEMISGILESPGGAWELSFNIVDAESVISVASSDVVAAPTFNVISKGDSVEDKLLALGLPGFLMLAFLGGLILNIMPCVLPVLSLKVFSLLKHVGQTRAEALRHGLAYTVGVVASFLCLAGVLFALRSVGERIGWGFQLQSPGFVVVLTAIFFLFGLNLMGVFELGSRLVGADASVAKRNDTFGSFGMGVLAAVVGAPCTGPLLAGVSGLAVQASVGTGLLIFGTMGLGLASPFLLLSVFPKLVAFLPKPGLWMESFKQGMGLLLMAAVVFLAFIAGRQGGVDAMFVLMCMVLVCGVAGWVFGRWGALSRSKRSQWIAKLLAIGLVAGSIFYTAKATEAAYEQHVLSAIDEAAPSGQWGPWSEEKVQELLKQGKPVFVDFTATWCLICQVNKKVALRTSATEQLFDEYGIAALSADWTSNDPVITDALERFGRSGVPLYVLYAPNGEVTVLPQSLTNGIVRDSVEMALGK